MPRPAADDASPRRTASRNVITSHHQSPAKLSLNDDRGEKVARMQSRQALQEIQLNEMRAVASPMRKINPRAQPRYSDVSVASSAAPSPHTPRYSIDKSGRRIVSQSQTIPLRGDGPGELDVRNTSSAMTPMKRVPILANFEEWMKLATDNKINAANSWNFALIDYFHDMSLLKEGDGVNFQKASCTLDGCVKIYTSRVDSVATETGRLLSGLADSDEGGKNKGSRNSDDDNEDGDEGEDGEEGEEGEGRKKSKKKTTRSHEATLAPSFASLQLKKLELEFAVDPLFKKASADFDAGGAKGLLLNHLSIDSEGRIVFDSSDNADEAVLSTEANITESEEANGVLHMSNVQTSNIKEEVDEEDEEVDISGLMSRFFPEITILDSQEVCPSMRNFKLGDPNADKTIPLLRGSDNWRPTQKSETMSEPPTIEGNLNLADQSGFFVDGSNGIDFDDDDQEGFGGFDVGEDVGFGQGGEAWAREAAIEPTMRVSNVDVENDEYPGDAQAIDDGYTISLQHKYREDVEQETMLAFFGKAFNSRAKVGTKAFNNLANWRIQKIQKQVQADNAPSTRQRKEKEPYEIDFLGPMSDSLKKLLNAEPANNNTISLPRTQLKTKGRNLLDKDDELIDVKAMMRLWTKPKCRVGRRKGGSMAVIDEGYGARGRDQQPRTEAELLDEEDEAEGRKGDYDANFFADDQPLGLPFDGPIPLDEDDDDFGGGIEVGGDEPGFVDAREMLSPPPDGVAPIPAAVDGDREDGDEAGQSSSPQGLKQPFPTLSQADILPGSFGSQLVTQQGKRLRPEYVNYARTAKKVDVRALKENMWKGMSQQLNIFSAPAISIESERVATPALTDGDGDTDMTDSDGNVPTPQEHLKTPAETNSDDSHEPMRFTEILSDLKAVYPEQQMRDISTSYGFICLLHLANEKGLVLEGGREDGLMNEILVRRDAGVGEGYVGE